MKAPSRPGPNMYESGNAVVKRDAERGCYWDARFYADEDGVKEPDIELSAYAFPVGTELVIYEPIPKRTKAAGEAKDAE